MAIFQVATNTPAKIEIIRAWLLDQSWAQDASADPVEIVGSFHLEDPEGRVGMQVHIVQAAATLVQVPLTYRDRRQPSLDAAYIEPMEHSVLGTRHVYDGFGDPRFVSTLAGVAACGYGQTLGFAHVDDRWQAWPESARVHGFGSVKGRVLVDGFEDVAADGAEFVLHNEHIEVTMYRVLAERSMPAIGMAATWPGQPDPVVLASVTER